MFASTRHTALLSALSLSLGLGACGGGSHASSRPAGTHTSATSPGSTTSASLTSTSAPAGTLSPESASAPASTVVASVAGEPIHLGEVRHLMALTAGGEPLPDPPSYKGCIARTKAAQLAKKGEGATQEGEAQLRDGCAKSYETALGSALSRAIHNRWLSGAAAEEGIRISPEAVLREFDESKKSFKSNAEFEKYRAGSGQSIADMLSEIKIGKVANAIFKRIERKEHPASGAEAAAYYDAHRKQFEVPEGRDLHILRTTTKAAAMNAKRELQSGKSFAEVVKHLSAIGQPLGVKNGQMHDLLPGVYEEKTLNDAIFTAKLDRLYGPFELKAKHKTIAPETNSGFFLYEVTGVVPGKQTPLAKVKGAITKQLSEAQKQQTVAAFVASFRAKWKARSDCRAGYVVQNCKQFKGGAEDPYTL
jgi:foldase protein PrsA